MLRRADAGDEFAQRKRPLAAIIADTNRVDRFYDTMFAPLAEAARLPFAQGSGRFQAQAYLIDNTLQEISQRSASRVIRHLFSPESFFFEEVLYQTIPISHQALSVDTESRQFLRGAGITLAIQSFRSAFNRWPDRLVEVASWVAEPLPNDLFTGDPLLFTASPPRLISVGKDLKPGTGDDLVFLPLTPLPEVR